MISFFLLVQKCFKFYCWSFAFSLYLVLMKFSIFSAKITLWCLTLKNKLIGKHENAFDANEAKDALCWDASVLNTRYPLRNHFILNDWDALKSLLNFFLSQFMWIGVGHVCAWGFSGIIKRVVGSFRSELRRSWSKVELFKSL